jgi:hypothetical protein
VVGGDRHDHHLRRLRDVLVQRRRLGELGLGVLQRGDRLVTVLEALQQLADGGIVVVGIADLAARRTTSRTVGTGDSVGMRPGYPAAGGGNARCAGSVPDRG